MRLRPLIFLSLLAVFTARAADAPVAGAAGAATEKGAAQGKRIVYVVPVQDEISRPALFILRRGLKQAIEAGATAVVLDMKTPGGALDVTFDIMEALGKFPGETITFVNDQAISAGAFISATTREIWFSPRGKIGAAAPVSATGQDIEKTMRQKIVSFLKAEVRSISEGRGYRGQVISAMIDEDYELKIGDKVIKPKGELLTLTATEAMAEYGEPPHRLLASGVASSIDDLLEKKFGHGAFEKRVLEVTWSEQLAKYISAFSSILMGLGLLALFIEFKTPGFGIFGITGIALLLLVFFGHYMAGLSGHEPALVFVIGVSLVAAELIFFPGTVVVALVGVIFMLGSLLWAGADLWPNEPLAVNADAFLAPAIQLGVALLISGGLFGIVLRFLPRTSFYGRLAVQGASTVPAQAAGVAPQSLPDLRSLVGQRGVAVTALFPSGEVEVAGRRYHAKLELGFAEANSTIVVTGHSDFGLRVEKT